MPARRHIFALVAVLGALVPAAIALATARSVVQLAAAGSCVTQDDEVKGCPKGKSLLGASGTAVTPDGKHVYVAASGNADARNGGLAEFSRDPEDGKLTQVGCVTTNGTDGRDTTNGECIDGDALDGTHDVAVSPDGKNVYAAGFQSSGVAEFSRDAGTGVLTQIGCQRRYPPAGTHCGGGFPLLSPTGVEVSPDGRFVYVAARGSRHTGIVVYARDADSGVLSFASCVSDDGEDGLCATANAVLGAFKTSMAPDGKNLYVVGTNTLGIFARDAESGALTEVQCFSRSVADNSACRTDDHLDDPADVDVSPDGKNVYTADNNDNSISIYNRDAGTGKLSKNGCVSSKSTEDTSDGGDGSDDAAAQSGGCDTEAFALVATFGVAVSPDGSALFATGAYDNSLVTFKRHPDGTLESTGCTAEGEPQYTGCSKANALSSPGALSWSPDGNNVYVAAARSNAVTVFGASVEVAAARVVAGRAAVRIPVACPRAARADCRGELRLVRHATRARSKREHRARVDARRGYTVRRGTTAYIRVRLSGGLRRTLERHGRAAVVVMAQERSRAVQPTARLVTVTRR